MLGHRLLAAEGDRTGRAGLHAGRLLAHRHAVRAQRALVGLVDLLGNARDVERAAGDAVAAANAVLFLEIDDAVGVLDDRARRRAGLQATRIAAVHAAFLADQPFQLALLVLVLAELHHRPRLFTQVGRVVIAADAAADLVAQVVPLHAGDLAGLATDALAYIDQLGDLAGVRTTRLRRGRGGGRAADDVQRLQRLRVAVTDGVGQRIGDVAGLGRTEETPVDRHAHLVHGAAIDLQGLDALGHHRHRFDVAALGTDPHAAAVVDAQSGNARSGGRWWPHAGTRPANRSARDRWRTRAPPGC
ncbi:hypothetical protein G6F68_010739 [Rhizopus microsporus]|nr:hypothetical protein G6F68_010739 [Rhizopus microsporus]